jgi:hypothetical protein
MMNDEKNTTSDELTPELFDEYERTYGHGVHLKAGAYRPLLASLLKCLYDDTLTQTYREHFRQYLYDDYVKGVTHND